LKKAATGSRGAQKPYRVMAVGGYYHWRSKGLVRNHWPRLPATMFAVRHILLTRRTKLYSTTSPRCAASIETLSRNNRGCHSLDQGISPAEFPRIRILVVSRQSELNLMAEARLFMPERLVTGWKKQFRWDGVNARDWDTVPGRAENLRPSRANHFSRRCENFARRGDLPQGRGPAQRSRIGSTFPLDCGCTRWFGPDSARSLGVSRKNSRVPLAEHIKLKLRLPPTPESFTSRRSRNC